MTQLSNFSKPACTHEFLCFGAEDGKGNPALVIQNGTPSGDQRQQFARDSGKTCVFIDAVDESFVLDFYYPHARSPLCVHAGIAAACVLADEGPVTVKTAMRGQSLQLEKNGDMYSVLLERQEPPSVSIDTSLLRELLASPLLELIGEARIASVGSPKLLVQVKDALALHGLRPNLAAITAWSKAHGVNGIYAWCVREDGDLEGRNFNHLDPAQEDSATGVAAGALTVLLARGLRVYQGAAAGNPCRIVTSMDGQYITIGGTVKTLL